MIGLLIDNFLHTEENLDDFQCENFRCSKRGSACIRDCTRIKIPANPLTYYFAQWRMLFIIILQSLSLLDLVWLVGSGIFIQELCQSNVSIKVKAVNFAPLKNLLVSHVYKSWLDGCDYVLSDILCFLASTKSPPTAARCLQKKKKNELNTVSCAKSEWR